MSRSLKRRPKFWSDLSYPILRSMVRLPPLPPGLELSLAVTRDDLEAAYRLLHTVYTEIGFMEHHPSGLRLNVYNMLPHTSTVVAKIDGKVVGTLSLIRENPLGLPLDESIDTAFFRKPGWQMGEVTGLAVDAEHRGHGQILFPLLKYIYEYGVHFHKIDVFQIATALSKEEFFRALLFFEPMNDVVFRDPMINGTPVSALYLDLENAKAQFKRAYDGKAPAANIYSYFTNLELPGFHFPMRTLSQAYDPVWTPEKFKYFFTNKTNLVERLSDREIHALNEIYQGTKILDLLPKAHSSPPYPPRRTNARYVVSCPAVLESSQGDESVLLLDVSYSGFRVLSKLPVRFEGVCNFRVHLTPQRTIPISASPVWNRRRREWGFTIIEAPLGWKEFLNHLELQMTKAS